MRQQVSLPCQLPERTTFLGVAEDDAPGLFEQDEMGEGGAVAEETFGGAHPLVFQAGFGGVGRELVAALARRSLGVVRQPVFVGIDADQIFQGAGDANFFVRLQLGQVDRRIGIHGSAAEQVLMPGALVVRIGLRHVIAGAVETAAAGVPDKFAAVVEAHLGCSEGIAGQRGLGNGDPVHCVPFFRPQVQQLDPRAGERGAAGFDDGIELAVAPQRGEGGIGLGRVADHDGTGSGKARGDPANDGIDDSGVSDDVFPGVGTGPAFVVFLHPIRLEHKRGRPGG